MNSADLSNTLGERAKELIGIAHPAFRDELLFEARKRGAWCEDLIRQDPLD